MNKSFTLVSHHLCPYVQRAAIALAEKGVPYLRFDVDLGDKPDWFKTLSPLGKVPVLKIATGHTPTALFESSVILEYLEETQPNPLHPSDPLRRAEHRAWIEFGSSMLDDIAGLYSASDASKFESRTQTLRGKFERLDATLGKGPFFDGSAFSLVDVTFGPIFRYFDVFDQIDAIPDLTQPPKVSAWRNVLSERVSIRQAVNADYPERLWDFLASRDSHLSRLIA